MAEQQATILPKPVGTPTNALHKVILIQPQSQQQQQVYLLQPNGHGTQNIISTSNAHQVRFIRLIIFIAQCKMLLQSVRTNG